MTTSSLRDDLRRHSRTALTFLREAHLDRQTTGAVLPSSRWLAGALTAPIHDLAPEPLAVLEVGAGTGSVTQALIGVLPPGSRLDVVEVNPRFAECAQHVVNIHPRTHRLASVSVQALAAEDLPVVPQSFDVIVSSLPLTNFTPHRVDNLMRRNLRLLRRGGVLTWFGYVGSRHARALTAGRSELRRHEAVDAVLAGYREHYATQRHTVWCNIPPADVWKLRLPYSMDPEVNHSTTVPAS